MAEETTQPTHRHHPFLWLGWLLAGLFAATAAGLAHHIAFLRGQVNASQGNAAQLQVQLQHADEIVDVLNSPDSVHAVLTETREPTHPVGQLSWLAGKGALVFMAGGLKPLPPDRTYELWLIPTLGKAPVPAGLFRPNADHGATVVLPPVPADTQVEKFIVTMEPAHGSETPSFPIVIQGR
ncbi:MAG: anti-sigma factor [Acidobacteriaceae bacterium]